MSQKPNPIIVLLVVILPEDGLVLYCTEDLRFSDLHVEPNTSITEESYVERKTQTYSAKEKWTSGSFKNSKGKEKQTIHQTNVKREALRYRN